MRSLLIALLLVLGLALAVSSPAVAGGGASRGQRDGTSVALDQHHDPEVAPDTFLHDLPAQMKALRQAAIALPIAAVLGAILAFRPRRRGTPPRVPAVIQTQIVLAVLGALIMLVVGASLARAFGIVGAAGLIRYRAKIADPKDAGVMLSTLGLGLASGVGLFPVAIFATFFLLGLLWVVESIEPQAVNLFHLKVSGESAGQERAAIENVLRRHNVEHELRSSSAEELCYEVGVPLGQQTDGISDAIRALDLPDGTVHWEDKAPRK